MEIRYEANNEISHIKYLKYLVVLQTEWETRSNQVEPGSGASLAWTLFSFLNHFVADIKKKPTCLNSQESNVLFSSKIKTLYNTRLKNSLERPGFFPPVGVSFSAFAMVQGYNY